MDDTLSQAKTELEEQADKQTLPAPSLSGEWRINHSAIEKLEYVEILRSLMRLAKYHTEDVKTIAYSSSSTIAYHTPGYIAINPKPIKETGKFPLPEDMFDVLCGLAIHETGHELVKSQYVGKEAKRRGALQSIIDLGEELVVDKHFPKESKQTKYIQRTRRFFSARRGNPDCNTGSYLDDACNAYISMMLYNLPPKDISDTGREILLRILQGFKNLTALPYMKRPAIYVTVSNQIKRILSQEKLKERVSDPRGKRLRSVGRIESYVRDKIDEDDKAAKQHGARMMEEPDPEDDETSLTDEEQGEIQDLLDEEVTDATETVIRLVKEAVKEHNEVEQGRQIEITERPPLPIVFTGKPKGKEYWEPDESLVKELQWLRNVKTTKVELTEKHLEAGRLDRRGLYRAGIDGLIFKQKRRRPQQKRRIKLVMDNSGSMSHQDTVFKACAAVHQVIPDSDIYLYEQTGHVNIIKANDQRGMRHIDTDGSTPSGDAIIYVAHLLQKEGGGILIHFTDGGVNCGMGIRETYEVLEHKMTRVALINSGIHLHRGWYNMPQNTRIKNVDLQDAGMFSRMLKEAIAKLWDLV